jgi:hypothetical protein
MLEKMKHGGGFDQKMANQAISNHFNHQNSLMGNHVEESVDDLIKKLES